MARLARQPRVLYVFSVFRHSKQNPLHPTSKVTALPVVAFSDLVSQIPKGMRLLGLDPGTKTIGLAISDGGFVVASPIGTIRRSKFTKDAEELAAVCKERDIGGLIMGLPVNMDGSEGPRCQSVRQLAQNLVHKAGFTQPIAFWDERLSTSAVERFLVGEADMTRKRRADVVDKMAAAYILQGALDALANQTGDPAANLPHSP